MVDDEWVASARRFRPWMWVMVVGALMQFGAGITFLVAGDLYGWILVSLGLPLAVIGLGLIRATRRRA